MAKSPLPLLKDEPVRASPKRARAASRLRSRASSGASVATTIMHEPSPSADPLLRMPPAGRPLRGWNAYRPSSSPTGAPSIVSTPPKLDCTSTPTV